jgi:hypothetical protein
MLAIEFLLQPIRRHSMQHDRTRHNSYHRRLILTAAAAVALLASVLATSAQATQFEVIGTGGTLHVRTAPSLSAGIVANLPDHTPIDVVCQTTGDRVVGSAVWDQIDRPAPGGYVADWYTTTPGLNGNFSTGLPRCGTAPPPPPPPPPPAFHCFTAANIPYETGTYREQLSGQACWNGHEVGANWFHAELVKKLPVIFATITGSGAFKEANAYQGPNAPRGPALTIWANEYIHTPGPPDTLFKPLEEEWRYPRVTVNAQGIVHECTWFKQVFDTVIPMTRTGYMNCR